MPYLTMPRARSEGRMVPMASTPAAPFFHLVHALAKHHVLAIEPLRFGCAQKELRAVGVRAGIGHGQDAGASVLEHEILVGELASIDGLAASAVASGEVASLAHEVRDDPMESAALEVQWLARLPRALLASAEAPEVLDGFGGNVTAELHDDSSCAIPPDRHVKEDTDPRHGDDLLELSR